jgi:hypothetical protein
VKRSDLDWFELRFPNVLDGEAAVAAFTSFSGAPYGARIILDLSATSEGITHHLAVSPAHREAVAGSLRASVPSLRLMAAETQPRTGRRALLQLSPAIGAVRSGDLDTASASLLASLFPLGSGELIQLRWNLRSAPRPAPAISGDNELRGGRLKALRAKLELPGLSAYGELFVIARSRDRRSQLVQRVASVMRSLATPYGNIALDPVWYGFLAWAILLRGRYLSAPELAAVSGWPVSVRGTTLDLPGLDLGAAKRLVPSSALPASGRLLGTSDFQGLNRPVALPLGASTRGLYVLGPTGTGKTSLLKNLIAADLEHGRGLCVLETNGDLITDVMDSIPASRRNDVVVIDPTDKDFAVGFNPFASTADPSLIADQLGELFERLWAAFWGPRTAQLTHMALLTLARRPGSTLLDLPRLYLDPTFRAQVLAGLDDPLGLGPDWQWFESLKPGEQTNVVSPLLNKSRQFVARPAIRSIVGQARPAISMRQIIDQQKVLLVHLPKGLIGAETAQLLGCLVLTAIWQAMAERVALPIADRRPFGLIVDEVQDFADAPIPWEEMFAQGRKYGLSTVVAHQNLEQLSKELREVILANARSKVVFALSASDAKVMERQFAPALSAADLQALDPYSVAAIVAMADGGTARPVTLTTPPPPPALGSFDEVRQSSRDIYGRPKADIDDALRARLAGPRARPGPVGRKPRSQS